MNTTLEKNNKNHVYKLNFIPGESHKNEIKSRAQIEENNQLEIEIRQDERSNTRITINDIFKNLNNPIIIIANSNLSNMYQFDNNRQEDDDQDNNICNYYIFL